MSKMPVIFVAHGSPMNAINDTTYTSVLELWGKTLPRPKSILMVSAHWESFGETLVQASSIPKTIYDFRGFPKELYEVSYPVSGNPELAMSIGERLNNIKPTEDWGLDHGAWSILKHMFPKADIPVVQLSIDFNQPPEYHYQLGQSLAYLRKCGVLIMGSGNIIHNLATVNWHSAMNESTPWARVLDSEIKAALDNNDIDRLIHYQNFTHAKKGIANPDHYYPLLYTLGAVNAQDNIKNDLIHIYEGFELGTLSMRSLQWNI